MFAGYQVGVLLHIAQEPQQREYAPLAVRPCVVENATYGDKLARGKAVIDELIH
jgi:hypothetical protein